MCLADSGNHYIPFLKAHGYSYELEFHLNKICSNLMKYEPRPEISNNVVCATSKGSDQPAHTRSLIRAFASHLNIL